MFVRATYTENVGVSEAESSIYLAVVNRLHHYTKGGDPFGADGDGEATGFAGGSLVKQRTSGFSKSIEGDEKPSDDCDEES